MIGVHHQDDAAEIASLKAQLEELQKELAFINAILTADDQARGGRRRGIHIAPTETFKRFLIERRLAVRIKRMDHSQAYWQRCAVGMLLDAQIQARITNAELTLDNRRERCALEEERDRIAKRLEEIQALLKSETGGGR